MDCAWFARWFYRQIVNKRGEGVILDIVLGIIGAIVGGWLFSTFGAAGVTGLNLLELAGRCNWFCDPTGRLPRH